MVCEECKKTCKASYLCHHMYYSTFRKVRQCNQVQSFDRCKQHRGANIYGSYIVSRKIGIAICQNLRLVIEINIKTVEIPFSSTGN